MSRSLFSYSLPLLCALASTTSLFSRDLVDKIVARVNGVIICASDLKKPQATKELQPFTLDEAIREELWVQRARERNALVTDAEVEKMVLARRKELGIELLTDEEANKVFLRDVGVSYDEYCQQIKRSFMVGRAQIELYNRSVVSDEEIREYCKNNPLREAASYTYKYVSSFTKLEAGAPINNNDFISAGTVKHDDVPYHLRVVYTLKPGERSAPILYNGRYIVVELIERAEPREKTVDERYTTVSEFLQNEKLTKASKELEKEILDSAVIVRF